MKREFHVRSCESRGVRFPPATHQSPISASLRHSCILEPSGDVVGVPAGTDIKSDASNVPCLIGAKE